MIRHALTNKILPANASRLARLAVGASMAAALMAGAAGFVAQPAKAAPSAPKVSLSKTFQPVAVDLNKSIEAAKARADVVAAASNVTAAQNAYQSSSGEARKQAAVRLQSANAALGSALAPEKTKLDAAFAAATTPDDRYMVGSLAVGFGGLAKDPAIQRRGLEAMLGSGKVAAADAPKLNFYLGQFAFDAKDYATARTAFQTAKSAGYNENDIDVLLAEAYISDNQTGPGLTMLQTAINARNATPNKAPASWYRRGLGAAYKAKQLDQAVNFAMSLVQAYPTTDNWAGAVTVVREVGRFPAQDTLNLMRLMDRTKSYAEERDYIEYIQAADARRLPGEVMKVINAGVSAGKLRSTDQFVTEARTIASGRVASDRATLPSLERDARAGGATAATAAGAADAFLSYGESAKAEALYTIALSKPGADAALLLTRLGIAQIDQGNFAGAQATLAKVTGPRQSIAKLWALYAAQKAASPA